MPWSKLGDAERLSHVARVLILFCQAASDKAIKEAISSFVARHPADPPLARFFDFASLQRAFKAQAKDLGFIDTTNGW